TIEANWRCGRHNLQRIQCRSENSKGVYCLQYDDEKIISGLRDNSIKVWSTSTCEFVRTLNGHKRGIACLQYRDRLVVSGSSDNTIRRGAHIHYFNERYHCSVQEGRTEREMPALICSARRVTAALYGAYFNMEHLMEAIINLCAEL
ncbi:unnamed protein product, partial [Ranitomeya imitator]